MSKRIFTLKESIDLLPRVQEITTAAVERAEEVLRSLEETADSQGRKKLEERYHHLVRNWAEDIGNLGAEVKGLWLVDFDSGDGIYYCWRYPESDIEFFHDYDTGFAGRRPLGKLGPN
jgi:hypothetical protein